MDIAYYISDLLGQQGELSVPNLGYFAQLRKPAYYDEMSRKFFPPQYVVQFDPQVIEGDDSLAEYITRLKRISLASSKYFIEKYITSLKNQVVVEDIPFADLGKFSSDGVKLSFHPGEKTNAPAFFALPAIPVQRLHDDSPAQKQPAIDKHDQFSIPPVINEPVITQKPIFTPEPAAVEPISTFTPNPVFKTDTTPVTKTPAYAQPETVPEYVEEETTSHMNLWTIVLIAVTVIAIAFVLLYKFKPGPFKDWFSDSKTEATKAPAEPVIKHDSSTTATKDVTPAKTDTTPAKTDTVKTPADAAVKQEPVTTAPPVTASTGGAEMPAVIPRGSWLIYAGTFPIRSLADNAISNYKSLGYAQARLLNDNVKVGNNYKVILGAYPTRQQADDAGKELLVAHKITIYIEKYK